MVLTFSKGTGFHGSPWGSSDRQAEGACHLLHAVLRWANPKVRVHRMWERDVFLRGVKANQTTYNFGSISNWPPQRLYDWRWDPWKPLLGCSSCPQPPLGSHFQPTPQPGTSCCYPRTAHPEHGPSIQSHQRQKTSGQPNPADPSVPKRTCRLIHG